MSSRVINKEIDLSSFRKILLKIIKTGNNTIKLLGGEPTLCSSFNEIIILSLKYFPNIRIFTNGCFSEEKVIFLAQHLPRVKFTFNIMTPSFISSNKIRNIIINRINTFSHKTNLTISLTIDPNNDLRSLQKIITNNVIKSATSFRIGLSNPIVGDKNSYQFNDYPKIGKLLYQLIINIINVNSKARFSLNCGFTRCMFSNKQYSFLLKNKVNILGWGCFGKASSMDIQTDLSAFHCLPLSPVYRLKIGNNKLSVIYAKILAKRFQYWSKINLEVCKKCLSYGHEVNKCPGPCIAFRMNNLLKD